jgi:hypothetical protein
MPARKITIVARGDTEKALDEAIEEAMIRIEAGNLSGMDFNAESSFYFNSTDDVPPEEMPR